MTFDQEDQTRDINLTYLMLAQAMIRQDKAQALYRLGISEEVADMLAQLSSQQLVRAAVRGPMLCAMRFDDELIWALLTDHRVSGDEGNAAGLHASVLMAGRHEFNQA